MCNPRFLNTNLSSFKLFIVTGSRATANNGFKSYPTTVKTFENDTVLLPCYVEDLGKQLFPRS